jgi:hypothetical protein
MAVNTDAGSIGPDLDLYSTDVLDARLVVLEYRPVTSQAT